MLERGCMFPDEMTNIPDKKTIETLGWVKAVERYFDLFGELEPSNVDLCQNFLKILN